MYASFGAPLEVTEVPEPRAPAGGAVVRVHACGLCRSDWHGWLGHDSDIVSLPHVPGHEFAGVVEAVGAGVDRAWLGKAVTAPFVQACGDCAVCRQGAGQVCPRQHQPGFSDPGSFAELVVVHAAATNLVALPPGLDPVLAAGLGCRVATAYRAVAHRADVRAGERVAVFGCGGVGLAAIAVAVSRGASVVAVDTAAGPVEHARAVGAAHGVVAAPPVVPRAAPARVVTTQADAERAVAAEPGVEQAVVEEIVDWSHGGVDVTLDAAGSPATCQAAIRSLARLGRHVQVGLLPPVAGAPDIPMDRVIAWEFSVLGSHGMAASGYPALLDDIVRGRLDLSGILAAGPVLTLAEAGEAIPRIGSSASPGLAVADPRT